MENPDRYINLQRALRGSASIKHLQEGLINEEENYIISRHVSDVRNGESNICNESVKTLLGLHLNWHLNKLSPPFIVLHLCEVWTSIILKNTCHITFSMEPSTKYILLSILTIAKHRLHVCSSLPNENIFSASCPCCLGSPESWTLSGFIRMISLHWAASWLSLQSLLQPTEFMAPPHTLTPSRLQTQCLPS